MILITLKNDSRLIHLAHLVNRRWPKTLIIVITY